MRNEKRNERIYAMVPRAKAIYLGRTFLQCRINTKYDEDDLFIRLCNFIKEKNIDVYVMKNKLMSYELYPEKIDIDLVRSLNEEKLYDKYLV